MKTFYKGTSAVILTYDITNQKSYDDLQYWYKQISNFYLTQRTIARARWLLCWQGINLTGRKTERYRSKRDLSMRRRIKQHSIKFPPRTALMLSSFSPKLPKNQRRLWMTLRNKRKKPLYRVRLKSRRSRVSLLKKGRPRTSS